jgi:hypothetical protein
MVTTLRRNSVNKKDKTTMKRAFTISLIAILVGFTSGAFGAPCDPVNLQNSGLVNWQAYNACIATLTGGTGLPSTVVQTNQANTYTAGPQSLGSQVLSVQLLNAASTGTTLNRLAKLTGAGAAVITATTDTSGAIGIVVAGAGTSGSADIAKEGRASCAFDGATTQDDYVAISAVTAGDCSDAGSTFPSSGQVIGRVLSSNGSAGTYVVLVGIGNGAGAAAVAISAQLEDGGPQTITNTTDTAVPFPSGDPNPVSDTGGFYSGASNTRLTAPTSSVYVGKATVHWFGSTGNQRMMKICKNGSCSGASLLCQVSRDAPAASNDPWQSCPFTAPLSAGDYIEVKMWQDTGTNQGVGPSYMSISRIGQ